MNYSDAERIGAVLERSGFCETGDELEADIIILITCSVRQKGEDRVFGLIKEYKKNAKLKKKSLLVGVTGCMVRKTGRRTMKDESFSQEYISSDALLRRSKLIDFVFRIEDTAMIPGLIQTFGTSNIEEIEREDHYLFIAPKYSNTYQSFIPIQTGCDNFCSYCIVPFTRGREWSRSEEEILAEIKTFVDQGGKEVTLVGQNVNSYGKQFRTKEQWNEKEAKWEKSTKKTPFTLLLEKVNEIPGIERIRFSASNPHDMTDDIIEAITTLSKVMPYLHFALQSGSNTVLQRMNRKHTYEDFRKILDIIRKRRPDYTFSTDIIVGFCGETDEEFTETVQAMKECHFEMVYIARYSPRKGTDSVTNMKDDISAEIKAKRWHQMNDMLKEFSAEQMKDLIGSPQKILIESWKDGVAEGRSEGYHRVQYKSDTDCRGEIVSVKIISANQWKVQGVKIPHNS